MSSFVKSTPSKSAYLVSSHKIGKNLQRSCSYCRKKRQLLQRCAAGQTKPEAVLPIVHEVLRSPGRPLDRETQAFMEPRFSHDFCRVRANSAPQAANLTIGPANDSYEQEADRLADSVLRTMPPQGAVTRPPYDFSRVRVHSDSRAEESARAVNARAYTVGQNIVFGRGMYAPGTTSGQRLIAHELAHTIQQSAETLTEVPLPSLKRCNSCPFHEQEAGASAGRSKAGHTIHHPKNNAAANRIQRQSGDNECKERGPVNREDHPLIYSCQEAHNLGLSESERCKRPAVGYAQRLLNDFLQRYDNWRSGTGGETIACIGDQNSIQAIRNSLRSPRLKVDCWFGSETDKVTRMFQRCHGLNKIDGKIGEETWPRLEEAEGGTPGGGGGNVPPRIPPEVRIPPSVFMCSKALERSPVGTHAFFRVGGMGRGNPTYSLEPEDQPLFDPDDLDGTHPWGSGCFQGIPMRNYPADVNANAQCELTSIGLPCLEREFASYPVGLYCTLGPNSNTFVGHVARNCGISRPDPPGWNPGIEDNPPSSGTFAPSPEYTLVAGCTEKICGRGM